MAIANCMSFLLANPICQLPPQVGPCRAAIPRYYYSAELGGCYRFFYGGCDGNGNNFPTEQECEEKCGNGMNEQEM